MLLTWARFSRQVQRKRCPHQWTPLSRTCKSEVGRIKPRGVFKRRPLRCLGGRCGVSVSVSVPLENKVVLSIPWHPWHPWQRLDRKQQKHLRSNRSALFTMSTFRMDEGDYATLQHSVGARRLRASLKSELLNATPHTSSRIHIRSSSNIV